MNQEKDQKETNIILFGDANQRKTSTLMNLAILLAGNGNENQTVRISIDNTFLNKKSKKTKRYFDARLIVKYKERLVYIATGGDTWKISRENYDFFFGKYTNLLDVYYVDASGVKELSKWEKEQYKMEKPFVSICACRPNGDSKGAIKAIHSYSEDFLKHYSQQVWINSVSQIESIDQAKRLLSIIDLLVAINEGKTLNDLIRKK